MSEPASTAAILIQTLRYLQANRNRPTVIKLGGSAMSDPARLQMVLRDVALLEALRLRPVVVHGGGPAIDRALSAAGLELRRVLGRRVTDEQALKVVARVLLDEINAHIVSGMRALGARAVSLHSGPLQCLFGERMTLAGSDGRPVDLGRVGRVVRVERDMILDFTATGTIPILPPLALADDGGWLNVNADTAAAAVARALPAARLVLLTDQPGVLRNPQDEGSLLEKLDPASCRRLINEGTAHGGMIPKLEACLEALTGGVPKAQIMDGRLPHALLRDLVDEAAGTEICAMRHCPETDGMEPDPNAEPLGEGVR